MDHQHPGGGHKTDWTISILEVDTKLIGPISILEVDIKLIGPSASWRWTQN